MTPNDAFEFFVELVSQLLHADMPITEECARQKKSPDKPLALVS